MVTRQYTSLNGYSTDDSIN